MYILASSYINTYMVLLAHVRTFLTISVIIAIEHDKNWHGKNSFNTFLIEVSVNFIYSKTRSIINIM